MEKEIVLLDQIQARVPLGLPYLYQLIPEDKLALMSEFGVRYMTI